MMNTETKRHIDTARQILVGVVPNPSTQIDQITNALIYKFMDDMDQSVIKIGGKPTFFTGDLEKYAWTRLMDSRIGSQERMNLYSEALIKFSQAKQLPQLFRDIFKLAILPYRSPEVLDLFLKEINYFDYSHSEELGNAFEYLLSVMGSQGDAGMFRTPRHIIDFIVDVVNPTKDDKVLDPACGTAGFLISAYKHILEQHDGKDDPKKKEKPLTPEQKKKLTSNFIGYDISPDMVRLSKVNMYLHNFKDPQIVAYNTLANEERWNDKFDVILANPPFMSAKGSVKPHSRFSIDSNQAQVLFVDYIMNHLRPKGRAGIIVPDGIVFASSNANVQLRKNLVEDGLYAVVSLPSGVFNPYAGVKTSILLFDNELAKQKTEILFVKVENDGFDLGAQRREISKNDLPMALDILNKWNTGEKVENKLAVYVEKSKIAENGDYNLSGDRYRVATDYTNVKWPMVELGEVIRLNFGERITKNNKQGTKFPVYGGGGESFRTDEYNRENEYVIARFAMSENCVRYVSGQFWMMDSGGTFSIKPEYQDKLNKDFVGKILLNRQEDIFMCARGGAQKNLNNDHFYELKIPLPPLEIQEQVVEQIDGYQKIIDGIQQAVSAWKPRIEIDPKWEKVKLGEVCEIGSSKRVFESEWKSEGVPFYRAREIVKLAENNFVDNELFISEEMFADYSKKYGQPKEGDLMVTGVGTLGICYRVKKGDRFYFKDGNIIWLKEFSEKANSHFIELLYKTDFVKDQIKAGAAGGTVGTYTITNAKNTIIPLPSLEIQKQIVEKIEFERSGLEKAKELLPTFKQHIKNTIAKLWSE